MPDQNESQSRFITVRQAADDLKVRPKTVYSWIRKKLLSAGPLPGGRGYRIRRTEWECFTASLFPVEQPSKHIPETEPQTDDKRTGGKNFYALGAARREAPPTINQKGNHGTTD